MSRFSTVREAKEYLIQRILAQADRDGVQLSDLEQKMLYFAESGWALPDMMAVRQQFDSVHDQVSTNGRWFRSFVESTIGSLRAATTSGTRRSDVFAMRIIIFWC